MTRTLEQINMQYRDLCAELGHLSLVKQGTDARLEAIRTAIDKLNKEAGEVKAAAASEPKLEAVAASESKLEAVQS